MKIKSFIVLSTLLSIFTSWCVADWSNHRGGSELQGISAEKLGDNLALEWTFDVGKFLKSSPVVSTGKIFLGGPTGIFYALDSKTGQVVWKKETGLGVDAPALVHNGKVYVGTKDGWLFCLDAESGKQNWTYETMGEIVGAPNHAIHPLTGRKLVLVGSYDNFVHCVDAEDGSIAWKFETLNYVNGTPAIWDKKWVVFGGCDAQLYVVSLEDGNLYAFSTMNKLP